MNLHEFTWIYMNLHEFYWIPPNLPEFTWIYLKLPEFTWIYNLGSLGFTWVHLGSLVFTREYGHIANCLPDKETDTFSISKDLIGSNKDDIICEHPPTAYCQAQNSIL